MPVVSVVRLVIDKARLVRYVGHVRIPSLRKPTIAITLLTAGVALAAGTLAVLANKPSSFVPYNTYDVPIGPQTVYVVEVQCEQGAPSVSSMQSRLVAITEDIGRLRHLPPDWRPDVLIVQPGLGANSAVERRNFARMVSQSGKDFAISVDMTDRFKWPWESGDLRMLRINKDVSRRFESLVCAANQAWGRPPDVVLESQATRLLVPGKYGSVTLSDLCEKGDISEDFKLNRVVCIGVPLKGMRIGKALRKQHIGEVMVITTPSKTGFIAAEPLKGEPSAEIKLRNGKPVPHKYLFRETWPDGQGNPIPDIVGSYLTKK